MIEVILLLYIGAAIHHYLWGTMCIIKYIPEERRSFSLYLVPMYECSVWPLILFRKDEKEE